MFPSLQRTKCTSTEIFHLPPGLKGKLKDIGALKRLLMLQVHKSNGILFNAHMPSGDKIEMLWMSYFFFNRECNMYNYSLFVVMIKQISNKIFNYFIEKLIKWFIRVEVFFSTKINSRLIKPLTRARSA